MREEFKKIKMKKEVDSIIDGHKFHLHPDKVAQWLKTGDCYPIHVEIGVTNRCNQNCIFCALDFARGKRNIKREVMLSALENMAKQGVRSVMFGGEGEPTLHKNLWEFVQEAKKYGLDISLTTNGIGFNKKLQEQCLPYLSWIKFSIDAGTPETYSEVHRTPQKHFELLFENIHNSINLKKEQDLNVVIGTQFLMLPQNATVYELKELDRRLEELKPDYLSIKPYSDHPKSKKNLGVTPERYTELERALDSLIENSNFKIVFRRETVDRIQEGNNYPQCYGLPFISLISSAGDVLPCNLFYNNLNYSYGNLNDKSFNEIWGGEKRKEVLDKLKSEIKNCRNGCRCDAGNRYLHRLRNPQLHDNFT